MGQAESRQEQFWEACGFGHTDKVKQLLDEGIDVNWVSKTHDSCPIHAASQGKPEIVKLLVGAGCDVNVRDDRQCTALHHAAMNGFVECARLLLTAGAVVNVQDKNKWTPLHNSAYWAHPGVTELLLNHKADVSVKNKDDRIALHEVARSKSDDEVAVGKVADMLIQAGCEIESRAGTDGFSDFTVLMFSAYHGHVGVVRHLIDARCEINAQSSNKWTALHWAADRGHTTVVELLLENGADSNLLSERKETARDRAKSDDIRAVMDKFCGTIPLPPENTNPKRQRTHSELSEEEMPDIKDFPQHLKPPSSNPATPKSGRQDIGVGEGDMRARCDTEDSSDSYQRAMANTPPSECATDIQSIADCTASLNGLVLATGEVIKSAAPRSQVNEDEGSDSILQAEIIESQEEVVTVSGESSGQLAAASQVTEKADVETVPVKVDNENSKAVEVSVELPIEQAAEANVENDCDHSLHIMKGDSEDIGDAIVPSAAVRSKSSDSLEPASSEGSDSIKLDTNINLKSKGDEPDSPDIVKAAE